MVINWYRDPSPIAQLAADTYEERVQDSRVDLNVLLICSPVLRWLNMAIEKMA